MSSVRINKKRPQRRKSADGVWRSRTYGVVHNRTSSERLVVRRRRARVVAFSAGAIFSLLIIGGTAYYSHQARFMINELVVQGDKMLSGRIIKATADSFLHDGRLSTFAKDSTFFLKKNKLENALLAQFPRLRDVDVSVPSYSGQLAMVIVSERTPYAKWCGSSCFLLDENGFVFASYKEDVLARDEVFYGGMVGDNQIGKWFLPTYFKDVIRTIDSIERITDQIVSVEVLNEHDYSLELKNKVSILVRFGDNAMDVAEKLKIAFSSEDLQNNFDSIEYIDLRFDGRVYYK